MSIIQCTECESVFDIDKEIDNIALWSEDGRCLCMLCFKELVDEGALVPITGFERPSKHDLITGIAIGGLLALIIALAVMYL